MFHRGTTICVADIAHRGCDAGWEIGFGVIRDIYTLLAYNAPMLTVSETRAFVRTMQGVWAEDEHDAFVNWIAANPMAGDLLIGSGGLRKVRWSRAGQGKSGGVRVITYALAEDGQVWLLVGYAKAKFDKLPTDFLVTLRKEIDDAEQKD